MITKVIGMWKLEESLFSFFYSKLLKCSLWLAAHPDLCLLLVLLRAQHDFIMTL